VSERESIVYERENKQQKKGEREGLMAGKWALLAKKKKIGFELIDDATNHS